MDIKEPNRVERINSLTRQIVAAGFEIHHQLGPGLLESVYDDCLASELEFRGLAFERQKLIPVIYKGKLVGEPMRLDFLIEGQVIVELKAVKQPLPLYQAQLLTYLRLAQVPVGLLLNFNCTLFKDGITRLVNHLDT